LPAIYRTIHVDESIQDTGDRNDTPTKRPKANETTSDQQVRVNLILIKSYNERWSKMCK